MRRPSWNKSQAIQQVISLKALLEPSDDDSPPPPPPMHHHPHPPQPQVSFFPSSSSASASSLTNSYAVTDCRPIWLRLRLRPLLLKNPLFTPSTTFRNLPLLGKNLRRLMTPTPTPTLLAPGLFSFFPLSFHDCFKVLEVRNLVQASCIFDYLWEKIVFWGSGESEGCVPEGVIRGFGVRWRLVLKWIYFCY